jgi:hypothetical protein
VVVDVVIVVVVVVVVVEMVVVAIVVVVSGFVIVAVVFLLADVVAAERVDAVATYRLPYVVSNVVSNGGVVGLRRRRRDSESLLKSRSSILLRIGGSSKGADWVVPGSSTDSG